MNCKMNLLTTLEPTERWIVYHHWSVESPSGWRHECKPKTLTACWWGRPAVTPGRHDRGCAARLASVSQQSNAWSNRCPLWTSQAADQIKRLYDLFLKVDATQVEVNPFGETPEGQGTQCVYVCVSVCLSCPSVLYTFSWTYDYNQKCHHNTLIQVFSPADPFSVSEWPQGAGIVHVHCMSMSVDDY